MGEAIYFRFKRQLGSVLNKLITDE